ncbi:MAG: Transcriptional regulator, DeoR family [Mucilaginibacter sp.]|nr:Transcriptional regulator, DeoR family [Mucilaginibacter sp.]
MLKAERLQKIVEQIAKDNKVVLDDLSQLLNVSTDTVRRDIKELSDKGLLKAVRGGAIIGSPVHPHFKERQHIDTHHKKAIAQKVLEFIKPGQVILVGAGTTTTAAIYALPKDITLTVVTNSFPIVSILEDYPNVDVFFIGGQLNKHGFSTGGYETIEAIRNFRADICLFGICSIDLKLGITGADHEESLLDRAMIETSKYIIALSTYDKIGVSDPYYVCAANAIDALITEKDPSTADLDGFKHAGILIK